MVSPPTVKRGSGVYKLNFLSGRHPVTNYWLWFWKNLQVWLNEHSKLNTVMQPFTHWLVLTTANSQYGYKYFRVGFHSRLIISQLMLWVDCVLHPPLGSVRKVFIRKLRSPLRGGLAVGPKNIECWRGSGRLIWLELRGYQADCSSCCWHKREERTKRLKLCTQKAFGSGEEKVQCNN